MLSACGSSSGSGSCGKVAPCAGDIVGNWTISSACLSDAAATMQVAQILPTCTTAMATSTGVHATGSASFDANMNYTLTRTISSSGRATIPPSCLQLNGVTLTCAEADVLVQAYVAANPTAVQSAHCAGSSSCVCNVTIAPQTQSETGTYTLSGTRLTLLNSTGVVEYADYCVQKNELHLVLVNATMPTNAMGGVNADADTVFTKS